MFGAADEIRHTDKDTGAQKCMKLARLDLIPPIPLWELGEHFGKGSQKYSDNNWRKGYSWSISYAALQRHLQLFWAGEEMDDCKPGCPTDCKNHTHSPHIIAAAWHCFVLREFMILHPGKDDRFKATLDAFQKMMTTPPQGK